MTDTWQPIDTTRALTAADLALATRLGEALQAGDRIQLELGGTLWILRAARTGQAQAAATDHRGAGPTPWCWEHQCTIDQCDRLGLLCDGEIISGPADPTGNAALTVDRAAADERELRRLAELTIRTIDRMARIAAAWPTVQLEVDDEPAGPGDMWCRSCWRDNRHCQPIEVRPDGKPYYAGLCRWCGQVRKQLGNQDPPVWLVELRHRGQRITEGMIAKAKTEVKPRRRKGRKGS